MAQWIWLQMIAAVAVGKPGALGATAPTSNRLGSLVKAACDVGLVSSVDNNIPGAWGHFYKSANEIVLPTGQIVQFRSTKRQSGASGSPVQSYTWRLGVACDELQDTAEQGAYPDIVARLRGGNRAPIMATATAKDSAGWRDFRDALSKNWIIRRLIYKTAWAVPPADWHRLKSECSPREWQRRGLALDVAPEKAIYSTWVRKQNVQPIPFGARDVTARVLAAKGWGGNFHMLIGHDPGTIQDVSIMLKAYQIRGRSRHDWFAVDEFATSATTTEEHCAQMLAHLRSDHFIQFAGPTESKALVIADPSSRNESRNQPHVTVYRTFQRMGFDIKSAAPQDSRVPKDARIEMLRRLICNANEDRHFYIEMADTGAPKCPRLAASIEMQEYDAAGQAEVSHKSDKSKDLSDFTASTGYALWRLEREFGALRGVG